jgi:hypothetical protein
MNLIAIEGKALQELLDRLSAIEQRIEPKGESPEHKWLDNQEFCLLLKISKRTAQSYRDQQVVAFSQIGSKVYYKLADVHALLESKRVAPLRVGRR